MCGISGILDLNGMPVDHDRLSRMISILKHRGPDETGVHVSGAIGLAHTRLSILDLACGQQPMCNEDGTLWISFNGEIFNYLELRKGLVAKGHHFKTQSDTEVILHLYEEKGEDCVCDFNGQWAFAIWDDRKRELFLSRDRFGVRPLFYTFTDRNLLWASEIKSLFMYPGVDRRLDLKALDQILTFWVTLPPRTTFEGVLELPPGHSLKVKNGEVTISKYWDLDYSGVSAAPPDECAERHYGEELFNLLLDATRIRLRSDVPVAAYLSGGLDSTLITALIRKIDHYKLRTFSIAFADCEFDESFYQHQSSAFFNTEHTEIRCGLPDIADVFPSVVWHAEKPILRTAPAPMFLLAKLVRDSGFKVVLTGEGSDEMFGGYEIFKEAKVRRFWARYPDSQLRPLLLSRLYPFMPNIQIQSNTYRQSFFGIRGEDINSPFFSHMPRWQLTSRLKTFFSDAARSGLRSYDGYKDCRELLPAGYSDWQDLCRAQYLESLLLLPGYILSSQGDRMAMAHSIEGRYPFLDYRIVEFAAKLPPRLKLKVLNEKYLLKRVADGLIPPSVIRRSKQPYRAPDGKSFFTAIANDYSDELLSSQRIKVDGIFDAHAVGQLVEKFKSGRAIGIKDNMALVGILSTQILVDQFIRNFGGHATHMPERRTAQLHGRFPRRHTSRLTKYETAS